MHTSIALLLVLATSGPVMAGAADTPDTASVAPEAIIGTADGQVPSEAYNAALRGDEYNPCTDGTCQTPPRLLEGGIPVYPSGLRSAGIEGSASILFKLDTSGRVVEPRVEQATHDAFGRAALEAVQDWRFAPAERDGVPVAIESARQVFPFQFTDAAPPVPGKEWGLVQAQPIEVCTPKGQRHYLARLICPNDRHPEARRLRSVGPRVELPKELVVQDAVRWTEAVLTYQPLEPGDPEYHQVDEYELDCGDSTVRVYLDMYHCDMPAPDHAPEGFRLLY